MALKIFYLTLGLLFVVSAADNRIVGGAPTTIEEFPYISAFIYHYTGPNILVQRCVGAILSSWHVLTTAFCFTGAILENMQIRAGSTTSLSGGFVTSLQNLIKHPDYVESPRAADIAVVVTSTILPIGNNINILYIPPQGTYIPDGTQVKIVSWGFESPSGPQLETLKTINLNKLPLDECQRRYAGISGVDISDPVICASAAPGTGMCFGDAGAPMVINQVVVGISSFYLDCGGGYYPDVFTRIDRYTNWILAVAVPPAGARNATMVRTARVQL